MMFNFLDFSFKQIWHICRVATRPDFSDLFWFLYFGWVKKNEKSLPLFFQKFLKQNDKELQKAKKKFRLQRWFSTFLPLFFKIAKKFRLQRWFFKAKCKIIWFFNNIKIILVFGAKIWNFDSEVLILKIFWSQHCIYDIELRAKKNQRATKKKNQKKYKFS